MKRLQLILMLFLSVSALAQKSELPQKYAKTITNDDLYSHLSILASDALEGRETGKRGQKMAAALISSHFESLKLTAPVNNSYYQNVPLYSVSVGDVYIKTKKEKFSNFEKIIYYGSALSNEEKATEIVFAGNGSETEFEGLEIKDKAILILTESRTWRAPLKIAKEKGASMVLLSTTATDAEFEIRAAQFKGFLAGAKASLEKPDADSDYKGIFFIAPSVATALFNKSFDKLNDIIKQGQEGKADALKKVKAAKITYKIEQIIEPFSSENVMGYMEGSDLKDELVVISAHYDHIGKYDTLINNGADDNGSGTSGVLEMAEAFALAKKDGNGPRRSVLFMAFTGEEKGLLGSEYYTNNAVFPMEKTIVDLNIDMIGRVDTLYKDNEDYVFLVGSDKLSTELHEISEKINSTYSNLTLDYTFNDINHPERIYYRSDHWNFAKNNIPVIFYTDGHHPDYHKPTDTVEKINFNILRKRTQLVFYTAWELANRDKAPVVDKKTE